MASVLPYLADALVVFGVGVITLGVYGIIRLPDTYARLHAASKIVFLGVISLLLASTVTGDPAVIFRVALIAAFLLVTTPSRPTSWPAPPTSGARGCKETGRWTSPENRAPRAERAGEPSGQTRRFTSGIERAWTPPRTPRLSRPPSGRRPP